MFINNINKCIFILVMIIIKLIIYQNNFLAKEVLPPFIMMFWNLKAVLFFLEELKILTYYF